MEPFDETLALTPDEEEGVRQAIASLEAGRGRRLEDVRDRLLGELNR